jgi:hypothetical protein
MDVHKRTISYCVEDGGGDARPRISNETTVELSRILGSVRCIQTLLVVPLWSVTSDSAAERFIAPRSPFLASEKRLYEYATNRALEPNHGKFDVDD